ncbi:MAG: M28 family peptidase [Gemmatimonadales bacterium]|nr:M28 family peptidase [Gemmatimonadales bacterium]
MLRRIPLLTFALIAFIGTAELAAQVPIVWADEGPLTWTPRPTESAIAANDLRTHLYQIADDSMKGRDAISLENTMTTDYVAAVFERLGLQPAGDDGYFQELEYGPIAFDRAASALRIDDRGLTAGTDWVPSGADSRSAVSGSFQGEDVETVFGGLFGDKSPLPATVRGKAVVLLAGPGAGMPQRRSIYRTDTRAQDAGAALVMIATEELSAALVTSTFDGRTSMMGPDDASTAGAVLSLSAAASLFDAPLQSVQVGAPGKTVSGAWSEEYRRPEYPTRNVIAILPGSDPALRDEYVLVGAHNDHVGMVNNGPVDHDSLRAFNRIMRPQGANDRPGPPTAAQQAQIDALLTRARSIRPPMMDSVMNGADDNGSGTSVLLEIAEYFATNPAPRRSLIFISQAGEEKGLLGSSWFVDHPTVPLENIVAAHNMDMLGKGRVTDVKFGGPSSIQMLGARRLSTEFGDVIDSLNAVRDEPMAIDYSWDRTNHLNRFCRSDQVNYFRKAIPVTYFSLGYAVDYHQATDEPRYIDYEHGAKVGRFVADIMRAVADRDSRVAVLPLEERDMSVQC